MAKKRRTRTSHPGVKLLKRINSDGKRIQIGRFVDPDTGRTKEVSLLPLGKTSAEARREWAITKSKSIATRKAEIASGAKPRTYTPLKEAFKAFYEAKTREVAKTTLKTYEEVTTAFEDWARRSGLRFIEDLTPPQLSAYRDSYVARLAHAPMRGKKAGRGTRTESSRKRSPHTINKGLNKTRTILNWLRKRGLLPSLTTDSIRDSLEYVKAPKNLPTFLRANELQALLTASFKHDFDVWDMTREEHAGLREPGTTPKWTPIHPFLLCVLLTGMRFGEAANLRWSEVDLDAKEIELPALRVKTKTARRIALDITPELVTMLTRMKLTAERNPFVFGRNVESAKGMKYVPLSRDLADTARTRLTRDYNAPKFTWHELRRTCGTFLTCAPSIYGAASAFLSAKRLGHSVSVAEKHYVGALTSISPKSKTLEDAMEITKLLKAATASGATGS